MRVPMRVATRGVLTALSAVALGLLGTGSALTQEKASLQTARELKWIDLPEPAGARQALLWGDPRAGDSGVLVRWPFNTRVRDLVRSQDVHIVVLVGTFTVDVQGEYREFGPGGFIAVPKGVKHTLGCEAAGECRFLVHHPGAVQVSSQK
jgi:mannose-6-phosphate isomerase-like protein (cupin superfamily)